MATACKNCKFLIKTDRGRIWYDQFCKAVKAPVRFDAYEGAYKPTTKTGYAHARDVNKDGQCPHFKPSVVKLVK